MARAALTGLCVVGGITAAVALAGSAMGQTGFVNFETAQVSPINRTPDNSTLLALNTPDGRLEVFNITSGVPVAVGSVPVGVDPVSVRARTNTEVWVVNNISDSISIVDLTTMNVVRTITTKDEPADVVFAGAPQRAFVTCSQSDVVQVFDPANLLAAAVEIPIVGNEPRALAVSPDGLTVYAAVFESGNGTTVLGGGADTTMGNIGFPPNVVNDPAGPYGGTQNPPPNTGGPTGTIVPTKNPANGTAPKVALIVRKNGLNEWRDDNNGNWTNLVSGPNAALSGRLPGWDLADHDLAVINTGTLGVTYVKGLMNICMAVGVNPATGVVTVVGTEATNEKRFEPNLTGTFVRVNMASVTPGTLSKTIVDLNPHLTYAAPTIPQVDRDRSIGDPRGIVWNAAGTKGYVTGMGSNNVIAIDTAGARAGLWQTIEVGEGPTGLTIDDARQRVYVLNKFAGSITVLRTNNDTLVTTVQLHDPSPHAIKIGRKYLYDTHRNSGLGQIACASCHVDSRMDRLAWDLGDPTGVLQPLTGLNLGFGVPGIAPPLANPAFQPFHPMKGPMTTQTLQDIVGHEPHHWRGDRSGLEAFANAFLGLQGDDAPAPPNDVQEFEAFLATIHFPPNPFRNLDNSLPTNVPLTGHFKTGRFGGAGQALPNGNAVTGLSLYRVSRLDGGTLACVTCHTLPTGAGTDTTWNGSQYVNILAGPQGERHRGLVSIDGLTNITMKVPQTRNVGDKRGFNTTQLLNTAGTGFLHDGSVDSIERFVSEPVFNVTNDNEVAHLTALMLAFSGSDFAPAALNNIFDPPGGTSLDAHAAVGQQITFNGSNNTDPALLTRLNTFLAQANANRVGLVVKGRSGGIARGWYLSTPGTMQSDRAGETTTEVALRATAAAGSELTYTVVAEGTERRIGVDRDVDTYLDRDEIDAGSNPADPLSIPNFCDTIDFNNDTLFPDTQDIDDFLVVFAGGACSTGNCNDIDFNNDGLLPDTLDIDALLSVFGGGPCL